MKVARHLLLFSILLFSACSGKGLNQDGGDLTRAEVEFLSRDMSAAIEKNYPILKHRLVNRYVDSLGQFIISHNPDMPPLPYEFRVLKTNDIGVFSVPGGIIYVTLGMLRSVELEGQLAGALAHELAHQQLNHPLILWRRRVNANRGHKYVLDFSGDFATVFLGPDGAFFFDEGMEKEADELAPVLLYRAKFDPRVYTSYLQLLKKMQIVDPTRVSTIFLVHPPIDHRLDWAKNELVKLPPFKDQRLSTQSFDEIKQVLKSAEQRGKKSKDKGVILQ